ncbi:hypothetical protein [Sellimonas intestinalis]|uniref:hypothetical protein n=1 Tax=Sellimonas intestinalis TaxID=1653434 RepID=UPI0039920AF8
MKKIPVLRMITRSREDVEKAAARFRRMLVRAGIKARSPYSRANPRSGEDLSRLSGFQVWQSVSGQPR